MNILQINLANTKYLDAGFLDLLTGGKIGIKNNGCWIFNTTLRLQENGNADVHFINGLLTNCQLRNFTSLMIYETVKS